MPTPDIYTLLMGGGPDAAASAQAMAEQIRRGRQAALAGALGSPGAIGAMGQQVAANTRQDQAGLEKAIEQRSRYGEEAKTREADAKRQADDRKSQLAQTLAVINANKPQFQPTPGTTSDGYKLVNGQWVPVGDRPPPAAKGAGGVGSPAERAEFNKLNQEMTPEWAVRSAFGQAGQQDFNAIRGIALAIRNKQAPNTAQQAELAALAGRMATGGVPTMHTMEQFNPGSANRTVATVKQWLSGKPVDPKMQEWADATLAMMEGESDAGEKFVRHIRLRNAERIRRYAQLNPESARRFISNFGLDQPDDAGFIDPETFELKNFKPNKTPREKLTGEAGMSPADTAALDWATENPSDPRAAEIKKRLKVK